MIKLLSPFYLSITLLFSKGAADEVLQVIDFEDQRLTTALALEGAEVKDARRCALKGFERERKVEISSSGAFMGKGGISYAVRKTGGAGPEETSGLDVRGNGTDKVHHDVFPHLQRAQALRFGEERHIGFAFKIDQKTELPDGEVIIFQLWQGSPFGPPFRLSLLNQSGRIAAGIFVNNDVTGSNPSAHSETVEKGVKLQKGKWYRFVIKVNPSHHKMEKEGEIEFWLAEGKKKFALIKAWKGRFGYDPKGNGNYANKKTKHPPHPILFPTFGIYRERQERLVKVSFDNVLLAKTRESADPLSWRPKK